MLLSEVVIGLNKEPVSFTVFSALLSFGLESISFEVVFPKSEVFPEAGV